MTRFMSGSPSVSPFAFTAPATASLPTDVQQAVDDNNGVLNVTADAMGQVNGTSYTTAAVFGAALGVGMSNGTLTTQAANARTGLSTQPRSARLLISNESATAPDSTATLSGRAEQYADASTETQSEAADSATGEWQSATSLSAGSYDPMRVGGVDYTNAPQSPVPDTSPSGKCYQGVEYRWVAGSDATRYTVVGEAHAYYNATASFDYTSDADSDISVGISYDLGANWSVSGDANVSNSVTSSGSFGFSGNGPYWAHKWLEPFEYKSARKQWRCEEGGDWHYWYSQIYSVRYHIPTWGPAGKYGEDVSFDDGPQPYGYANRYQRTSVPPGAYFISERSTTRTCTWAASVFGFGPSVTTYYNTDRRQRLYAMHGKYEHDVFTDDETSTMPASSTATRRAIAAVAVTALLAGCHGNGPRAGHALRTFDGHIGGGVEGPRVGQVVYLYGPYIVGSTPLSVVGGL